VGGGGCLAICRCPTVDAPRRFINLPTIHSSHPLKPPVCSTWEVMVNLAAVGWGGLVALCIWPPVATLIPR